MHIIAAFPGLIALIVVLQRGSAFAFLNVYFPVVILLPSHYRWYAPGLPDLSFQHAAIMPIALIWLLRDSRTYQFSLMDIVVVMFASLIGLSEFTASGYKDAQNLIIDVIASMVLPYFLAKTLIVPNGLSIEAGKRMVILLFAVAVISLWEFKMAYTPWDRILNPFFPGQDVWITTFRWGFTRVAGPYGHAILAGIIMVVGFRLQRWLHWRGHWDDLRIFGKNQFMGFSFAFIITWGMVAGVIMTMCKGPWIGAIGGAAVMAVGRSRRPGPTLLVIAVLAITISIPGFLWLKSWAGVGRENAKSVTQETAAYRWELIETYWDVALEHAWLGWGRHHWPKDPRQPSIDNYYLLLALMHGILALYLLWFTFVWMSVRLMIRGVRAPPNSEIRILTFTLASVYAVYFISLATVYLGSQTVHLLFILTGWAEGVLVYNMREPTTEDAPLVVEDQRPFKFKRTLT
ncbi:MAG: O-antigen ligase domain-containing protein [Halochromatium sp.]|nr:O-antigen ligase domain-containing protein [Halochromatium sp.]